MVDRKFPGSNSEDYLTANVIRNSLDFAASRKIVGNFHGESIIFELGHEASISIRAIEKPWQTVGHNQVGYMLVSIS